MKLRRYTDSGRILTTPADESGMALFRHCANGMSAVTTTRFTEVVRPLLVIHGADVSLDDETEGE